MPQRQLNHLPDECECLPAPSDVILTDLVQFLFILSVHWFPFVEYFGFVNDDAKFRLTLHDFELNAFKITMDDKCVSLFYRSKIVLELSFNVPIKKVSCDSFNTIRKG